ncbi:hypothetical protein HPB52_016375 [Rhipicephalus sanguineus]|uniref:HTH psq-type domain-containing protein n=1 Tax=Rhipicephalus sanguineus TaxID=34632 RepID=A0A9D4SPE9_RHISA|nr:hypothetical protein HPB52_016375 [Rhipicephalus sanguineus]
MAQNHTYNERLGTLPIGYSERSRPATAETPLSTTYKPSASQTPILPPQASHCRSPRQIFVTHPSVLCPPAAPSTAHRQWVRGAHRLRYFAIRSVFTLILHSVQHALHACGRVKMAYAERSANYRNSLTAACIGHSPKYSDSIPRPFSSLPPLSQLLRLSTPARIPKFLFLGRNELRQGAEPFYAYLLVCRTCTSCSLLVCVCVRMVDGKPSAQTDGTKRKALDISTKRAILNELAQGAKNCELVKKYRVSKSTISTILKNKDKIISADANSTDIKRLRRATYADDHSGGDLWQRVVDSDMGGRDICWDDFVMANDDANTAEPCTDEGIVNEVRGKSDSEESDDDDDETLEPAPTSVPVAIGYIDSLRQLLYAKGLGEEHAAALNKLETTLIASALSKQTCITDFFAKK